MVATELGISKSQDFSGEFHQLNLFEVWQLELCVGLPFVWTVRSNTVWLRVGSMDPEYLVWNIGSVFLAVSGL